MIHLISLPLIMNAKAKDLRLVEDYENEELFIETTTFSETTESEEIDIETTTLLVESGWYLWQPGPGYGQGNGQWYRPPWIIGPGSHHKEPSGYFDLSYSLPLSPIKTLLPYQWRWKQSEIGCAVHRIRPKYLVRKIYILFTNGPNIGCANVHPAHPAPPPLDRHTFLGKY